MYIVLLLLLLLLLRCMFAACPLIFRPCSVTCFRCRCYGHTLNYMRSYCFHTKIGCFPMNKWCFLFSIRLKIIAVIIEHYNRNEFIIFSPREYFFSRKSIILPRKADGCDNKFTFNCFVLFTFYMRRYSKRWNIMKFAPTTYQTYAMNCGYYWGGFFFLFVIGCHDSWIGNERKLADTPVKKKRQ